MTTETSSYSNSTSSLTRLFGNAYPIVIISLCAGFLFYKYILQVYPGIITDQLMQEFNLTGAGLGNLAATFYYSYMIMQLFVGVLLDKYGARLLSTSAVFISALGLYIFSQTHNLLMAELARGLMGVGVAFATVAYMKIAAVWFAPQQYAFVGGLLATAAMAGAVFGEAPLSWLVNEYGWRQSLMYCGVAGLALAFLLLLLVRERQTVTTQIKNKITFKDILEVLKNKQNWLLTLYSGLAFSPIAIFGGLWGNPFLQEAYHVSKTQAASLLSLIFIGLGVGSPLIGALSDRLGNRKDVMFYSTLTAFIAVALIIYWQTMPTWLLSVLLFTFGFTLGAFMLSFTIGKEINKVYLTATVIAMINTCDAVLDAVTEPAIGKLLDMTWHGKIVNGVHYFSLHDYQLALSVLPIYLLLATGLLLFIKDKTKS